MVKKTRTRTAHIKKFFHHMLGAFGAVILNVEPIILMIL